MLCLCLPLPPPSLAPHALPPFKRSSVFTSCFLSTHPTSSRPPSLPASPAENDSRSIFTLWSSPPFFPLFLTTLTFLFSTLFFSLSSCPCECCVRTLDLLLGGGSFAWWRHGKIVLGFERAFYAGHVHSLPLSCSLHSQKQSRVAREML